MTGALYCEITDQERIALIDKKEVMKDMILLAQVFACSLAVFWIVFYKEPVAAIARLAISFAFVSYVPGYFLTKNFFEQKWQRLLIGSAVSIAIIGITAYYLGLLGVPLNYSSYILPLMLLAAGLVISR